jgi:hypothetical protein
MHGVRDASRREKCSGRGERRLLYARSVLKRQSVTLALHAGIVDQNSPISSQASKGDGEMRIKLANFAHGVWL